MANNNPLLKLYDNVILYPALKLGILGSPVKSFVTVSGVTALSLLYFKPQSLFDDKGKPRAWRALHPGDQNAVPLDWISLSLFIGTVAVLIL